MSNTSNAQKVMSRIRADVTRCDDLVVIAFNSLATAQPGIRSVPTTSGRGGGQSGDQAIFDAATRPTLDGAVKDRRAIAKLMLDVENDMMRLKTLLERWAAQPEQGIIWCEHCIQHGHRHVHDKRRVEGLLVCRWAAERWKRTGTLPTFEEVDLHSQGIRIETKPGLGGSLDEEA